MNGYNNNAVLQALSIFMALTFSFSSTSVIYARGVDEDTNDTEGK